MKKHLFILLASLFVVVAFSGCTIFGTTIGGTTISGVSTGVIIKSFKPDISEVYSGDSVIFSLSVENVGGEDANNVQAKIFGLGTDWTGTDWTDASQKTKTIGFLERNQPEYNVPGGSGDTQWEVISPVDLKVDNTYTANVRLYYSYATTALANVKIYNNDYLKSNPENAEQIMKSPGIQSLSITSSPLSIELAGLARPLVYRQSGQSAYVTVLVSNVGQGKPYDADENDMTITVDSLKVNGQTCGTLGTYRLPRTGKKSLPCSFTLPAIDEYTTIPLEVVLSYNYFVDGTTSVKVLKSPATSGGSSGGIVTP